jgi:outer membrane receptor protein involved in Fe transport
MHSYFNRIFIVAICLIISQLVFAQNNTFTISGIITDASTGQTIDYATVTLKDIATNKIITGITTDDGGRFELEIADQNVFVEVSFIGYETKRIKDLPFKGNSANLGEIKLGEDSKVLDEVLVTAEKSTTEFKLDKRVFNVGTDLSSTGASALEVLNNVPSVNVNIEGQVSLRGASGVQILINGKPSILADDQSNALGSITADMMEKVEVITNPSAKYEAEGTSGIINIILKKNENKGLNGSISLNTGVPHNHSVGVSLNRRTDKFNLFTQLGLGYKELPSDVENINRDFINNTELRSIGEEFRNEVFYNFILGADYYINPLNIITLSGSYAFEDEKQPSETTFEWLNAGILERTWTRNETTEAGNPKFQYELKYSKDFEDDEDHRLLFSAIGNYFGKDQSSYFTNNFTLGTPDQSDQLTETEFKEGKYTFNLDYTKPFDETWTIETGVQYLINNVSNDYAVKNENELGEFVIDEGLTNIFEYDQKVLGFYGTGSYEGKFWGLKLGLRAENTDLGTELVNTNEVNNQKFTDLFPSAHTSYKLSDGVSFQAGYSRRIFRPRLWDLNPFFNIRNNFSVRTGNPNLLPEYTNSYEAGAIFIFEQTSFNVNVYHRYTTDKVERISFFENSVNTWRPENIGTNKATGVEANFKYSPTNKITLNGDANYNVFKREGEFNDQTFDFSADQWSGKIIAKYKISKALDTEVTTNYESKEQTIQGEIEDNLSADFGVRYKIMNGKAVLNMSIRDVFASRVRQNVTEQDDFYNFYRSQRGRFITFGFSYGFGKGEAMQYSGGRRR